MTVARPARGLPGEVQRPRAVRGGRASHRRPGSSQLETVLLTGSEFPCILRRYRIFNV